MTEALLLLRERESGNREAISKIRERTAFPCRRPGALVALRLAAFVVLSSG